MNHPDHALAILRFFSEIEMKHFIVLLLAALCATPCGAVEFVPLRCGEDEVSAIIAHPSASPAGGVVYTHGFIVEKIGWKAARQRGYDVSAFVDAFAREGYVAIAPVRTTETSGIDCIRAAIDLLQDTLAIPRERVVAAGFSRGGGITLQFALTQREVQAYILMSPAIPSHLNERELGKMGAPTLITLGARDPATIRSSVLERLVPALQKQKREVEVHSQFDGDHRWFWQIRPEYWSKISAFLKRVSGEEPGKGLFAPQD